MSYKIPRLGWTAVTMTVALACSAGCGSDGKGAPDGSAGAAAGASGGATGGSGGRAGTGGGAMAGTGGSVVTGAGGGGGTGAGVAGTGGGAGAITTGGSGDGAGTSGAGGGGSGGGGASGAAGASGAGGRGGTSGTGGVAGASGSGGAVATGGSAGSASGGAGGSSAGGAGGSVSDPCAQPWAGDLQIGTALDDEITAVTAAPTGGFYVTGYEHGDDNISDVIPAGDAAAVIARYDRQGVLVWKSNIDTSGADTAEDVQIDPATGNLIVLGRTTGALPGFQNAGQMDMYVSVLNSGGDRLGSIQIGDERPQHPVRLGIGPNNKILAAGYDDIFISTNYVAALSHGFLAEFTIGAAPTFAPTENFWQRSQYFPSPPPPPSIQDFTTGVAIASGGDGTMYVSSTVDGSVAQRGMFLTKLDAAGNTIWSNRFSTTAGDYAAAVALSPNGDLFVAGAASVEIAGVEVGQQDAFVAKFDKTTGAAIWATVPNSPDSDFPTAMTFDPAGNVYLTGQTLGTISGGATNKGGIDIFAVKIGASGGILSAWERGSAGDDMPAGIAVDTCGRVIVGGFTTGALIAGQPSAGRRDSFIVQADLH